jgi:hypothetical protein
MMAVFLLLPIRTHSFLSYIEGAAASKYFEGVLFIIARRPYDIG